MATMASLIRRDYQLSCVPMCLRPSALPGRACRTLFPLSAVCGVALTLARPFSPPISLVFLSPGTSASGTSPRAPPRTSRRTRSRKPLPQPTAPALPGCISAWPSCAGRPCWCTGRAGGREKKGGRGGDEVVFLFLSLMWLCRKWSRGLFLTLPRTAPPLIRGRRRGKRQCRLRAILFTGQSLTSPSLSLSLSLLHPELLTGAAPRPASLQAGARSCTAAPPGT
jgi:hypothetical protein